MTWVLPDRLQKRRRIVSSFKQKHLSIHENLISSFSNLCQSADDDDDDDSLSRLTRIQDSPIESNHAHSYMYVFIDSIIVYVCHPNLTTRERGLVTQFIHFLFNRWWWSVLYWEKKANGYVHEHEQFNFLISFFSHYMHTN